MNVPSTTTAMHLDHAGRCETVGDAVRFALARARHHGTESLLVVHVDLVVGRARIDLRRMGRSAVVTDVEVLGRSVPGHEFRAAGLMRVAGDHDGRFTPALGRRLSVEVV